MSEDEKSFIDVHYHYPQLDYRCPICHKTMEDVRLEDEKNE